MLSMKIIHLFFACFFLSNYLSANDIKISTSSGLVSGNKTKNVIIFEDDAILYEDNFNFEAFIKKKSINLITWMGGCINQKNNYIYCLHSYYIPSYGFIGFLLNEIEDSDNKRAIDSMFVNIIQKKNINYGYFDVFRQMQNTYSYIDNSIKQKPGTWCKKNCKNAT